MKMTATTAADASDELVEGACRVMFRAMLLDMERQLGHKDPSPKQVWDDLDESDEDMKRSLRVGVRAVIAYLRGAAS